MSKFMILEQYVDPMWDCFEHSIYPLVPMPWSNGLHAPFGGFMLWQASCDGMCCQFHWACRMVSFGLREFGKALRQSS